MKSRDHTYSFDGVPEELRSSLESLDPAEARALVEAWNEAGMQIPGSAKSDQRTAEKLRVRRSVLSSIESDTPRALDRPALRLVRSARFVSVAATVLALVIVSFLLSPDITSHRAPVGSLSGLTVDLPDGSAVTLSPGSRLYLTDAFGGEERAVHLHGTAFFDVQKDDTKPFTVRTFDARTTVLGTSFDVQAWPSAVEAETAVHVLSGRVRVTETESKASVTLSPGEGGSTQSVSGESIVLDQSVDVERATAWRSGGFSFENEPVGDVISEINRRFDIRVQAPASIRLRRISYWKQSVDSADEIMSDIAATIGVRYRRTANGFSLYLTD